MIESPVLSPETLVPIGVAASTVVAVVAVIWRVATRLTLIDTRLASIEDSLREHWTRADQLSWVMDLREKNPEMHVPKPDHNGKERL